jgi:DNA modification methylase
MSSPLDATIPASHQAFVAQRPPGADEDVHMLPEVVDHVIERCTRPDDVVFDPFAGFGTTLGRAVALGRQAVGVELLPERVDYIEQRIPDAYILEGDARELLRVVSALPHEALLGEPRGSVDLVLTSPPYMTETHHDADPLTAYERDGGDYTRYLAELGLVAAQCAQLLKPGGFAVWNVADIDYMGHTTHLIADCAEVLAEHLVPLGVTVIEWDTLPHDLVADALLVFQRGT